MELDDNHLHDLIVSVDAMRVKVDNICLQTARIYQKQEEQDKQLHVLAVKIEALETQNRVLKWVIGSLLSAAAIAVAWMRGT